MRSLSPCVYQRSLADLLHERWLLRPEAGVKAAREFAALFNTYRDFNVKVLEDQERRRLYHAQASLQRQEPSANEDGSAKATGGVDGTGGQVGRHDSNTSVSRASAIQ